MTMTATSSNRQIEDVIQAVRLFMRDFPQFNRLIEGEESNDRMIAFALVDAVDEFNNSPPLLGPFDLSTFPSIHLLIRMTVASLLDSVVLLNSRNYLQYHDGGGTFSTSASNVQMLMNWANMLKSTNAQKIRQLKIAINIQGALGNPGLSSEYDWVHGYLYRESLTGALERWGSL
jgi:hypothetical protein